MIKSIIKNGLQRTEKEEWKKKQDSPDSRFGTLQSSESGYPEDRTLRNHLKMPQEVNNSICEAVNCFSPAEIQLQVKVGQLGSIPLLLCNDCARKFGDEKI
jgi:hypothetical protein